MKSEIEEEASTARKYLVKDKNVELKKNRDMWRGYEDAIHEQIKSESTWTAEYGIGVWYGERYRRQYADLTKQTPAEYKQALAKALSAEAVISKRIGRSPCSTCLSFLICGKLNIACRKFGLFLNTGRVDDNRIGLPNRDVFRRISRE